MPIDGSTQLQVLAGWNQPRTVAKPREADLQHALAHPRQLPGFWPFERHAIGTRETRTEAARRLAGG